MNVPTELLTILNGRSKDLNRQKYAYELGTPGQFGLDVVVNEDPDVDESSMSFILPFADGKRRDGVGDLLEVGGINCERHQKNPVSLLDHGKQVLLPIGKCEDPATGAYTVEIDPVSKIARARVFIYQGKGLANTDPAKENEHALLCAQIFDLWAKRFIRAGSIGYQVVAGRELGPDYETGTPKGVHLLNVLMLECSTVVMPANMDTVKGLRSPADLAQEVLCMGAVCGKPLSPVLVKSFSAFAPEKKVMLGWEGKSETVPVPLENIPDTKIPPPEWKPGVGAEKSLSAVTALILGALSAGTMGWTLAKLMGWLSDHGVDEAEAQAAIMDLQKRGNLEVNGENIQKKELPRQDKKAFGIDDAIILGLVGTTAVSLGWLIRKIMRYADGLDQEDANSEIMRLEREGKLQVSNGQVSAKGLRKKALGDDPTADYRVVAIGANGERILYRGPDKEIAYRIAYQAKKSDLYNSVVLHGETTGPRKMKSLRGKTKRVVDDDRINLRVTATPRDGKPPQILYDGPDEQQAQRIANYARRSGKFGGVELHDSGLGTQRIKAKGLEVRFEWRENPSGTPWERRKIWVRDGGSERQMSFTDLAQQYGQEVAKRMISTSIRKGTSNWHEVPGVKSLQKKSWNEDDAKSWYHVTADGDVLFSGSDKENAYRIAYQAKKSGKYQSVTLKESGNPNNHPRTVQIKSIGNEIERFLLSRFPNRELEIEEFIWDTGWDFDPNQNYRMSEFGLTPEKLTQMFDRWSRQGTKSLDMSSVRKKYRPTKTLRRRLRKSVPGSSLVHVAPSDLNAAREMAEAKGLKFDHVGSVGGLSRVKLMGDDSGIDAVAQEFGKSVRGRKSLPLTGIKRCVVQQESDGWYARFSPESGDGTDGAPDDREDLGPFDSEQEARQIVTRQNPGLFIHRKGINSTGGQGKTMRKKGMSTRGSIDLDPDIRRQIDNSGAQLSYAKVGNGGHYLYFAPGTDIFKVRTALERGGHTFKITGEAEGWVKPRAKSLKAKGKNMDNTDDVYMDDDPLAEDSKDLDTGMNPEHPFSAQVLKRLHEKALEDLEEFDGYTKQLEHPEISKHLQKYLEGKAAHLDEIEALHAKHHPELPGLGDAETKDLDEEELGETEGELDAIGDELDDVVGDLDEEFDDTEEDKDLDTMDDDSVPADSASEDEPTPEEALEGMETADGAKHLRRPFRRRVKSLKDEEFDEEFIGKRLRRKGIEEVEELTEDEKRLIRRKRMERKTKSVCPECGIEGCDCTKSMDGPPPEFTDQIDNGLDAMDQKGLEDHEMSKVGEAAQFAKELATTDVLDEEKRMKAYHYKKTLEGMGQIEDLAAEHKSEFVGDPQFWQEEGAEAEHKDMGTEHPGAMTGSAEEAAVNGPAAEAQIPPAKSIHPHRQACKDAAQFFGDTASTKDWGRPHQEHASVVAKALEEVAAAPINKPEPVTDEAVIEVGEMGEKSRRFLRRKSLKQDIQRVLSSKFPGKQQDVNAFISEYEMDTEDDLDWDDPRQSLASMGIPSQDVITEFGDWLASHGKAKSLHSLKSLLKRKGRTRRKSVDELKKEEEEAKALRKNLIEQQKQVKELRRMINGIGNMTR